MNVWRQSLVPVRFPAAVMNAMTKATWVRQVGWLTLQGHQSRS